MPLASTLWSAAVRVCGVTVSVYGAFSQAAPGRGPALEYRDKVARLAYSAVQPVLCRVRDWGRAGLAHEGGAPGLSGLCISSDMV